MCDLLQLSHGRGRVKGLIFFGLSLIRFWKRASLEIFFLLLCGCSTALTSQFLSTFVTHLFLCFAHRWLTFESVTLPFSDANHLLQTLFGFLRLIILSTMALPVFHCTVSTAVSRIAADITQVEVCFCLAVKVMR